MYKIISVRRALSSVFLAAAAALLASCGGGGASSDGGVVSPGPLQIFPATEVQAFGNNPVTISVQGGRPPYTIESSDTSIVQGPIRLGTNQRDVTIVPLNPSFIEKGLDPEKDLLFAPVNLQARDSAGNVSPATKLKVVINFVAGALLFPERAETDLCQFTVCSGTTTVLTARVAGQNVDNGYTRANRVWRFDVEAGDLFLAPLSPQTATCNASGKSCLVTTDQNGVARVRASVPTGTPPQFAVLRITDVDTENKTRAAGIANYGFTVNTLTIGPAAIVTAPLSVLPSGDVTITGATTASCGQGAQADYYIFGGLPPYTVNSPLISVATVSPAGVAVEGGRFTATVAGCGTVRFIVVDSAGNRVESAALTAAPGTTPPVTALQVSPQDIILGCGQSTSVNAIGGGATKVGSSVTQFITITGGGGGGGGGGASSFTIARTNSGTIPGTVGTDNCVQSAATISDGSQSVTIRVRSQPTCPVGTAPVCQ